MSDDELIKHLRGKWTLDKVGRVMNTNNKYYIEQVEEDNSYGVIDWFSNRERGQVLIPRSNLALNLIPDGLRELGFQVTTVTAYENIMPSNPKKVNLSEIDRIIFTSPSTIDNFVKLYGYLPTDKELKTRGVVTEKHLMEILNQNI